jgi:hypothetical protein
MSAFAERLAALALATSRDVLLVLAIVLGFQFLVLRRPLVRPRETLIGFGYAVVGLTFFLAGLEQALFPLGRTMARQLTDPGFVLGPQHPAGTAGHWLDYLWVYAFGGALAFATAVAEPALMAVALKAREVSGGAVGFWGLRLAVAFGAGVGTAIGTARIVTGGALEHLVITGYLIAGVQAALAPRAIVPLAFDSGGVTTSTVTVPLITALGLGLAGTLPGRSALRDGFGLIAITCLFPIIAVMGYAQLITWWTRRKKARHHNQAS